MSEPENVAPFDPPSDFPPPDDTPHDTEPPPTTISEHAEDLRAEIVREMSERPEVPSIETVAAVHKYFIDRREDMQRQISEIEAYLGFVAVEGELSARVAKIEKFLGVTP